MDPRLFLSHLGQKGHRQTPAASTQHRCGQRLQKLGPTYLLSPQQVPFPGPHSQGVLLVGLVNSAQQP